MDPSLLQQRKDFKARALATPATQATDKRKRDVEPERLSKKPKQGVFCFLTLKLRA